MNLKEFVEVNELESYNFIDNWKEEEFKFLYEFIHEHDIDIDVVIDHANELDELGMDIKDIDTHIYAALEIVGTLFLDDVIDYCNDNDIDYSGTILKDEYSCLNIVADGVNSKYNSIINEHITTYPSQDDIEDFLSEIGIDLNSHTINR